MVWVYFSGSIALISGGEVPEMTPSLNLKFQLSGHTASGVRVHRVDCYGEVSIKFHSSYTYRNSPIRRHEAFVSAMLVVWKQIHWISHPCYLTGQRFHKKLWFVNIFYERQSNICHMTYCQGREVVISCIAIVIVIPLDMVCTSAPCPLP